MVLEKKGDIIGKRKREVKRSGILKEDRLEDCTGGRRLFIGGERIGKGLKIEESNGRLKRV